MAGLIQKSDALCPDIFHFTRFEKRLTARGVMIIVPFNLLGVVGDRWREKIPR